VEAPLRVVAIGGGTGLSSLLAGLKRYAWTGEVDITAIVTVTDDGGSSGRLRRQFDVLPPGDIRNCMVALSEDSALLSRLFQYRFETGRGLKGHSFGNLFLMALTHIMGDFPDAVKASSEVLKIAGRIFPATAANVALEATLANGTAVIGETRISRSKQPIQSVRLVPRKAQPLAETLAAIAEADVITLGPGSLFTSVIPNLLVQGIPAAVRRSPAVKAYFVNLMSQPGETTNFRASDHVAAIDRHTKVPILDVCVVNSHAIRGKVLDRYRANAARPVENDIDNLESMGLKVIAEDLVRMSGKRAPEKIRHDSSVIGAIAFDLARKGYKRKLKK
jgi:uncharacterized cofD-like protein